MEQRTPAVPPTSICLRDRKNSFDSYYAASFSYLVIPCTQLIFGEEGLFPAVPQEVVVLLLAFIKFHLFQLCISELPVNRSYQIKNKESP